MQTKTLPGNDRAAPGPGWLVECSNRSVRCPAPTPSRSRYQTPTRTPSPEGSLAH
ncbi:integral membrane sensor signal transduction histidine kinase [Anopheles sinensis]|uniref:Integral membrane sensor signal transduction histidine kinase n=1 Tax=Anopheles sinensis TaxID=74873 RepID=A0A084WDU4_ANOSI|nr:integral membrane sensor signal transduction histidine kinase [Anopheles sinensis]